MHQRVDDPLGFAIVECWASQEHLDTHLALPKVKDLIATLDGLADGQPAFGVYATLAAGAPEKGGPPQGIFFKEPPRPDRELLPHDPFKAMIAPRPVGWISTIGPDGEVNL